MRSDKIRLSLDEETVHGTTDGTPTMLVVEHSSLTFSPSTPKAPSDIVRTDARLKGMVPLNTSAGLSFDADLVYPTVNQGLWSLVRAVLNSTETAQQADSVSGASNGIAAGGTTVLRTSGDWTTNFKVGDLVKISNASTAADNRYGLVTTVATGTLTLQLPDAATWAGTDTDVTVTRAARMIDNTASSERAFSFEVAYLDSQLMDVFAGQVIDLMEMSFAMGQKSTIRFGTVGRSYSSAAMSTATVGITGATYTAATQLPVFGPTQTIYVVIGGNLYPVQSLTATFTRGCRARHSTEGGATPDAILPGRFSATLSMSIHREVATLLTAAMAGTEQTLWVLMNGGGGRALSFSYGTVSIDSASTSAGGMASDVMVAVTATATHNDTRDAVVTFQRWQ